MCCDIVYISNKHRKVKKMADLKIELDGKEYQLFYLNDLADSQATELYETLKELIETDWSNPAMQDNYRLYICEVERVLGSRGLL
jgi:hypothetical protein|tara:strand:- start:1209 stop:1463 length:255 start_codon:yes stop_codon:yes gene_type:complete